jgi:hypothetical protein
MEQVWLHDRSQYQWSLAGFQRLLFNLPRPDNILFKYRPGWSKVNPLHFYSGGAMFESRPRYQGFRSFLFRQMSELYVNSVSAASFQFIGHPTFRRSRVSILVQFFFISRYSAWLRAGRPRGRSLSPARGKNFLFSTSSGPALGSTHPPIQLVARALYPGGKAAGAWSWPLTSNSCRGQENVHLYIHSPIRLQDLMLNYVFKHRDNFTFTFLCFTYLIITGQMYVTVKVKGR